MKSFAVASLLVAVVAAADSIVPSGISSACAANLNSLNTDTQLQTCLNSVLSATSSLTASSSSSAINTALTSLCSTSTATACPDSLFRSLLTKLYSDCKGDFGESTGTVAAIYDALYNEPTFRKSVCTTDPSSSKFCVETLAAAAGAASSLVAEAQTFLSEAGSSDSDVKFPNGTTWGSANLVFQFLTPQSPNAVLCSPCATEIMQAHVTDETSFPFAPGISSSNILSGQNALWTAMSQNCASANSIVANAGAAPSAVAPIAAAGALNGASNTKVSAGVLGVLGALAAVSVVLTSL